MFEANELNIYLSQIVNLQITENMNKVICNELYLENLFFTPHVPMEIHNLLSYIYNTNSFQHHKETTTLKISYMTAENEAKKSRNGVLFNVLLYIVSLIEAISTLDTLECNKNYIFHNFLINVLITTTNVFSVQLSIANPKGTLDFTCSLERPKREQGASKSLAKL